MRTMTTIVLAALLCGGCWTGEWRPATGPAVDVAPAEGVGAVRAASWEAGRQAMLAELTAEARSRAEAVVQGREDGEAAWVAFYNGLELRRGR